VLIGDILLCEAMDLILGTERGRYMGLFVAKIREVCAVEVEQELLLRGQSSDEDTCLRIARGKTGPLFALVGKACGGDEEQLAAALEESGYRIGAAYQLADDLLDQSGANSCAGKTLGTDRKRHKFTLAQLPQEGQSTIRNHIRSLCGCVLDSLDPWPSIRGAVGDFLLIDLHPTFELDELDLKPSCSCPSQQS
jgi:octaprenyl-diphosphate synthase